MLTAILRSLRTGVVTIRYPEDAAHPPERFRGAPSLRPGSVLAELPPQSICPSGAIAYERLDGGEDERAPIVNVVRVRENGPLAFNAPLELDGQSIGFRATLCRCGLSKNKPYCDTSHVAAGFIATGEPATQKTEPLAERAGTLAIAPQKDGPLRVTGNVEVVSGTGRTMNRMTKVAFFRCGHSSNKPYCDGTHKTVGFKSE